MAELVAAFGSSHSVMLAATRDDWIAKFRETDPRMPLIDKHGQQRNYNELLAGAPADAADMVTPEKMAAAYYRTMSAIGEMKRQIESVTLDALIVVGDDQEELFHQDNMPAIGIYYGETIRGRLPYQKEIEEADYPCHAALARHLIAALQQDGFDLSVMRSLTEGRRESHA